MSEENNKDVVYPKLPFCMVNEVFIFFVASYVSKYPEKSDN
jgi:hypothetical protein